MECPCLSQLGQPFIKAYERTSRWYWTLPLVTRVILTLNTLIYLLHLFFRGDKTTWCNSPLAIYKLFDKPPTLHPESLYRLVTASFIHGGIFHIFFNMLCFQGIGSLVERHNGSFLFFCLLCSFAVLGAFFEDVLAFLLYACPGIGSPTSVNFCSIGYSGVIFGLIVLTSNYSLAPTTSLFGFVQVPTHIYPWVLLVVLSLLFPGISFLGHLGGMLAAYLYTFGFLNFLLPSTTYIFQVESSTSIFSSIFRLSGYVFATGNGRPTEGGLPVSVPNLVQSVSTATTSTISAVTFQPFTGEGNRLGTKQETEKENMV